MQSCQYSPLIPEDMLFSQHSVCRLQREASWLMWEPQPRLRACSQAIVILQANWTLFLYSCAPTAWYNGSEVLMIEGTPVELTPLKIFQRQNLPYYLYSLDRPVG